MASMRGTVHTVLTGPYAHAYTQVHTHTGEEEEREEPGRTRRMEGWAGSGCRWEMETQAQEG